MAAVATFCCPCPLFYTSEMKSLWLTLLVLIYWCLHQDWWNWRAIDPLAFGFLPIGLWYHAAYTAGISLLLWLLVHLAWPSDLERDAEGQ